jgi:EpsI family protein
MLASALFLSHRTQTEQIPGRQSLSQFPHQIGDWTGRDVKLPPDVLEILGPGDFLTRIYQTRNQPYVDFFIAYFPSQRTSDTIHSPKNCLPGAGWSPVQSGTMQIPMGDSQSFVANRYVIARGAERQVVLYWYQAHDRRIASEYWAKFYLISDSIRKNRTDGALVRIITPVSEHEKLATSEMRAVSFAKQILPGLARYIPR